VLADAQAAGYAEADPTADVEGLDAASKIVILARLAFGGWLASQAVVRSSPRLRGAGAPGITGVTARDVAGAAEHGLVLRLVAVARPGPDGTIAASVVPTAVPADSPLGRTRGVLNRIEVDGSPIGSVAFAGPGAGGDATSSAILGDLVSVARGAGSTWAALPEAAPVRSDPDDARDAWLGTPRSWLAVVPGGPAIVSREPLDAHAFRRELASIVPADADAALYPVEGLA
jgi:homoserine dehydrogenase